MLGAARLGAHLHDTLVTPCSLDHQPPLADVVRARLLHVDMFAGFGGEDGGRCVPVIRRGYENGVHTFSLQYFPEVAHLLRFDAGAGLDQIRGVDLMVGIRIADKRDFDVLALIEIPDVIAPHAARADDAQRHLVIRAGGLQAASPNNKVSLGIIGPGGMGRNHIGNLNKRKDIEIAFVCDPDSNHQVNAANLVESGTGIKPKQVSDLREILEAKSVDAVFIATPDHWHAPAAILAAEAGKHVYVEKPCSHNVREGRLMIEAARRNKRVMQVGTQSRSTKHVMKAMELLHNGAIGRVLVSKAWNSQKRSSIGKAKPSAPPAHLDFETWLGPAPKVPYQPNMLHGIWRWWQAFGTGDMGNDGVHDLDIARWGLGVTTHPSRIAALGGKYFFDDDQQFPDTQNVLFEYAPSAEDGRPGAVDCGGGEAGARRGARLAAGGCLTERSAECWQLERRRPRAPESVMMSGKG